MNHARPITWYRYIVLYPPRPSNLLGTTQYQQSRWVSTQRGYWRWQQICDSSHLAACCRRSNDNPQFGKTNRLMDLPWRTQRYQQVAFVRKVSLNRADRPSLSNRRCECVMSIVVRFGPENVCPRQVLTQQWCYREKSACRTSQRRAIGLHEFWDFGNFCQSVKWHGQGFRKQL